MHKFSRFYANVTLFIGGILKWKQKLCVSILYMYNSTMHTEYLFKTLNVHATKGTQHQMYTILNVPAIHKPTFVFFATFLGTF